MVAAPEAARRPAPRARSRARCQLRRRRWRWRCPCLLCFPENEDKAWDEDSILSWSDTPRRHGATDEATSAPCALLLTGAQTLLLCNADAMPVRHLQALTELPCLSAGLHGPVCKPVEPGEGLALRCAVSAVQLRPGRTTRCRRRRPPQHELMVQEDRRDWAEEQMAQGAGPHTAARDDAAARLRAFEDISAGDHGLPLPPLPLSAAERLSL